MSTVYLAGPMSGIPQFNYPLFQKVAETLRERGQTVINPAEMDDPAVREVSMVSEDGNFGEDGKVAGHTWGDFLSRDVKIVADLADEVCLLPDWETSRGARTEAFIALNVGKPVFEWSEVWNCPMRLHPQAVMKAITKYTLDQGDVKRYG